MQISYETFWTDYPHLVSLLMPPLQPGDGASEEEILAAENRLGIRLPPLLREFYARTSRREDINATHNRLIRLDAIEAPVDGRLIFYVENQGVTDFGIDLSTEIDDPLLWSRSDALGVEWGILYDRLSMFLCFMLLEQVCQGVLPCTGGEGHGTTATYNSATAGWEHISAGWIHGAVKCGAAVIFFEPNNEGGRSAIWAGCTDIEDAKMLEKTLEVGFGEWPFDWIDPETSTALPKSTPTIFERLKGIFRAKKDK